MAWIDIPGNAVDWTGIVVVAQEIYVYDQDGNIVYDQDGNPMEPQGSKTSWVDIT